MSPKISVITVCKNCCGDFIKTRSSVLSQTFQDFEWIIVDGASTDGTAEIIKALKIPNVRWVSEPDSGIYDAMNKGLRMAVGERVWFMNAGDRFQDEECTEKVAAAPSEIEICFGEVMVEDGDGQILGTRTKITPHKLPRSLQKSHFRHGMVVSHQAFVVKREIAPAYQSDRYKYSADLDWILGILRSPRSSNYIGTLATIKREGATMENWSQSQWERFQVMVSHFGLAGAISAHAVILSRRLIFGLRKNIWR